MTLIPELRGRAPGWGAGLAPEPRLSHRGSPRLPLGRTPQQACVCMRVMSLGLDGKLAEGPHCTGPLVVVFSLNPTTGHFPLTGASPGWRCELSRACWAGAAEEGRAVIRLRGCSFFPWQGLYAGGLSPWPSDALGAITATSLLFILLPYWPYFPLGSHSLGCKLSHRLWAKQKILKRPRPSLGAARRGTLTGGAFIAPPQCSPVL